MGEHDDSHRSRATESADAGHESVAQALARARRHARAAAAESVAAIHALLDAGSLASSGTAAADGTLAPLAELMRGLEAWLGAETRREGDLYQAMLDALDTEIARWEQRSRDEPEARTVLRAFLAVRELLWELERRTPAGTASTADTADSSDAAPTHEEAVEPQRLRRVAVQG